MHRVQPEGNGRNLHNNILIILETDGGDDSCIDQASDFFGNSGFSLKGA